MALFGSSADRRRRDQGSAAPPEHAMLVEVARRLEADPAGSPGPPP